MANDFDAMKARVYRANWGPDEIIEGDVRDLRADLVTELPDLVWASPPCQDVSHAGGCQGLDGERSGAVWSAISFIRRLASLRGSPRLIVIENVLGLVTSRGGADLAAIIGALAALGYQCGAFVMDTAMFLPQSRARIFILGIAQGIDVPDHLTVPQPILPWHPGHLVPIAAEAANWLWFRPPPPVPRKGSLADLLDRDDAVIWHSDDATQELLAMMSAETADRMVSAREAGPMVGTLTRRMRLVQGGSRQRVEIRLDGLVGCLRTPAGGSSWQTLIVADHERIRTRPLTTGECARLMGAPDGYVLPERRQDALRVLGDGVAVPVVRYLASTLIEPLLMTRPTAAAKVVRSGIKGNTRATTAYLLPPELKRLRLLALELDVSLHDLILSGLDRVLAENGQKPLDRYK